jgi:hypothetical protein
MENTGYSYPILMKLEFSQQILGKILKYKNFMKIRSVGTELFRAGRRTDRQTDMTKIIVAFRNFANAPKNAQKILVGKRDRKRKAWKAQTYTRE